ncbi:MAG: hypothetical protein SNG10_01170 [Rikenellaceae bacterium]
MKKIFTLLSLVLATLSFSSCELENPINPDQIFMTDIYGKWEVSDNQGYSSLEFTTEGYYFMVKNATDINSAPSVVYGKYTKTGDYQITLAGFGTVDITSYGDDYLRYTLTKEGDEDGISQSTTIAIDSDETISDNTSYISTIWSLVDYNFFYSYYSADYGGMVSDLTSRDTDVKYLYFSTGDTFIVINKDQTAYAYEWKFNSDEDQIQMDGDQKWSLEGNTTFGIDLLMDTELKFSHYATFTFTPIDEDGVPGDEVTMQNTQLNMEFIMSKNITFDE